MSVKSKIVNIVRDSLKHRGYSSAEANKFISVLTNIEFADLDVDNIFLDIWGSQGPDNPIR